MAGDSEGKALPGLGFVLKSRLGGRDSSLTRSAFVVSDHIAVFERCLFPSVQHLIVLIVWLCNNWCSRFAGNF
jgi:hypothetical protein